MKLSVCIPVYGVSRYIEQCVRSLFAQTYADMEYIFVDDCTPDDSMTILTRVLEEFPSRRNQVKVVRHAQNAGLIRARKTALAAATGELVAHCDPDDWVDADFYEKLALPFADEFVDMTFAPMVRNEDDPLKGLCNVPYVGTGLEYLDLAGRVVAFNSNVNKVWRRLVALADDVEVPDAIKMAEDMCRTCQTAAKCRKVVGVTGTRYHYRVNRDSMSQKFDARRAVDDLETVYRVLDAKLPQGEALALRKIALRDILFYGLRFGVMGKPEFEDWSIRFHGVAAPWPADTSIKRRLLLALAFRSYVLARGMFAALRWWKFRGF